MTQMDAVYADRNRLAQLAGRLAQELGMDVRWGVDPEEPAWPVLFIVLPDHMQVSWHIPEAGVLLDAPEGGRWDGHTDDEKAARIAAYVQGEEYPHG